MSIADTVKDNVVVFPLGIAITAFGAVWAACKSVNESQGQELILKTARHEAVQSQHQERASISIQASPRRSG